MAVNTSGKTNKSFAKRLRVTKKKKVLSRAPGHGHFNAKETGKEKTVKKRMKNFKISRENLGKYLPFN